MSLFPILDDCLMRPSRILDQHFGLALDPEDLFQPLLTYSPLIPRLRSPTLTNYLRPWRSLASESDIGSTVNFDGGRFQANLDVQQFKPEEVTVKITGDNTVTVEGRHEERQDQHGYISRHFVRKYVLPHTCDINRVQSQLSSDGVLTITAPSAESTEGECKQIPVQQTGQPVKKAPTEDRKAVGGDTK